MSICVYCRVKERKISTQILEKVIKKFRFFHNDFKIETDRECITYEDMKDDAEIISFVNKRDFPYNIYDSSIVGDYEHAQLLVFDIRKDRAVKDEYEKIICFCISLGKEINSDILISSDVYDDICLMAERKIIWSDTYPYQYDIEDGEAEDMKLT